MSTTPQPPIDPSVAPINNTKTSILSRPQYTSWMKSQSVNRHEEAKHQKTDNEKKRSSGIAQQRIKMIGGIPVSENTGLYVALSPEAQKSLMEKEQSHKKIPTEELTGISVSSSEPKKSAFQQNAQQETPSPQIELNEELPLINPFLPTAEELSLQLESQNTLEETSKQVDESSAITQEIKSSETKISSIFDIEIQSALNQIQHTENSGDTGEEGYDDNRDNPYLFSQDIDTDSEEGTTTKEDDRDSQGLTKEDRQEVNQLKKRDSEVRAHEMAHMAAAGGLATGPYYEYQQGPDSKQYAVGGHVNIDTSPGNTPEETVLKASRIRAAAMAPIDPSSQDRIVAAQAARMESAARVELASDKINPIEDSDNAEDVNAEDVNKEANTQSAGSFFDPEAPMFTPSMEDTSHISSTAPSISIIPRKSSAEIYASGFSSIHPVEDDESTPSNYLQPSENVNDRIEQTRTIKGIEGYNKTKQSTEDIGGHQSTKRYRV
jgi:hypothetical protein